MLASMTTHDRPFGRYLEDFTAGDVSKHGPGKTITECDDHLYPDLACLDGGPSSPDPDWRLGR